MNPDSSQNPAPPHISSRPRVITGNWKMYKTSEEAVAFIQKLASLLAPHSQETLPLIGLAVPFTAIKPAVQAAKGTSIRIGAQNMNDAEEGAFTGEVAGKMLVAEGAHFVILGHSERRHIFKENNHFINRKVKRALKDGLKPLLCIGETLEEREKSQTEKVIQSQLNECLEDISSNDMINHLKIAYEPVWAIGTGRVAEAQDAERIHQFCRSILADLKGSEAAQKVPLLYGGSVKPENSKELLSQENIDGLLIGGASLKPETFYEIIISKE